MDADSTARPPAILVISGTQGAGKTTVASLLARRFERGVHVSADALQKMIVSGSRWPEATDTNANSNLAGEAGVQLRLRLRNMCLLGLSFYEAGFTVVLDDIIVGQRFDDLLADLDGVPFLFVMLAPSKEAVRAHERERGTRLYEDWEWLTDEAMKMRRVGLWIDNSHQRPGETVDEIVRRACGEARVTAPVVAQR